VLVFQCCIAVLSGGLKTTPLYANWNKGTLMKKIMLFKIMIISILLFSTKFNIAQVIEGNVNLASQTDVNAFIGSSITGNLEIRGADITDLATLYSLNSVGGDLRINYNYVLTNLDGLDNITSVGGNLAIWNNADLTNLDGLSNITFVEGALEIDYNYAITNLDGLGNTNSVGWDLHIVNNYALTNLVGLSNITSVGGNLYIAGNDIITNLGGLSNITFVGRRLQIDFNDALTNLDGLSNITFVGADLRIDGNDSLYSFCGLYALLNANGLKGSYFVSNNLLNPTQQEILNSGPCTSTEVVGNEIKTPISYKLEHNYPNPFNPLTKIVYQIPKDGFVTIKLYDGIGQEVKTLVNEQKTIGSYELSVDGSNLASGTYYYRISVNNFTEIKKMIILK